MVHCADCGETLDDPSDIEFVEKDSTLGFIEASKRFYHTNCAHCGASIGGGIAAAKSNGGAAAGGADD